MVFKKHKEELDLLQHIINDQIKQKRKNNHQLHLSEGLGDEKLEFYTTGG